MKLTRGTLAKKESAQSQSVLNKLISPMPIEQEARRKERKKEKGKTEVCFYSSTTSLFSNSASKEFIHPL